MRSALRLCILDLSLLCNHDLNFVSNTACVCVCCSSLRAAQHTLAKGLSPRWVVQLPPRRPKRKWRLAIHLDFPPFFPKQCGHTWWSHTCAPLLLTLTAQKLLHLRKSRAKLGLGMCERQIWWPLQHKGSLSSVFDGSLARNGGSDLSLNPVGSLSRWHGANFEIAPVTFSSLCAGQIALVWRGAHFEIARAIVSSLSTCRIARVALRVKEILRRDLEEVFCREFAQKSCWGDLL